MHGDGGVLGRYYGIWSMSRRYAFYWDAFLFAYQLALGHFFH